MSNAARTPVALGLATAVGVAARKLAHDRAARRQAERREFRLHDDEHGADAIRRIAIGRIDDAVDRLRAAEGDDLGEAIHDARKAFKRARAAIRVGREAIGEDVYARENAAFRDVGRNLAPARDAEVVVETLDELAERYRERLPPYSFAGLRTELAAGARTAPPVPVSGVISELAVARERIATVDGTADDAALAAGFRRVYRRGRRAFRQAKDQPDPESLHELRKRSKDLWHAAQIMRPAASKRMRKVARRAHKLADTLGDDHDVTVLHEAAAERFDTLSPGEAVLLQEIVDDRHEELRREALHRGRRLYSRKPRKVAGSIRRQ
jgi:CHAD domain-containing protein